MSIYTWSFEYRDVLNCAMLNTSLTRSHINLTIQFLMLLIRVTIVVKKSKPATGWCFSIPAALVEPDQL